MALAEEGEDPAGLGVMFRKLLEEFDGLPGVVSAGLQVDETEAAHEGHEAGGAGFLDFGGLHGQVEQVDSLRLLRLTLTLM